MEKSHSGKYGYHIVLVAGLYDCIVPDGAARLCDIGNASLLCPFNVVSEREECVTAYLTGDLPAIRCAYRVRSPTA